MDYFSWQPEFELGISKLDESHRNISNLLNQLGRAIQFRDTSVVEEIADEIFYIFGELFKFEGILLKHSNYSRLEEHLKLHQNFLVKLNRLNIQMKNGDKLTAARKMNFEVKNWLFEHIQEADLVYVQEIKHSAKHSKTKRPAFRKIAGFINYFK